MEAEAAYYKLCREFREAALYAVHLIVKRSPTSLNLLNLYGDEGDKYIIGGILVRRAKDWNVDGVSFSEQALSTTLVSNGKVETGSNLMSLSGKIATLEVRNYALLRNRIPDLIVPLACLVDYYGLKFEAQSLAPISINSLVYGSDLQGLLYKDEAEDMAR